MRTDDDATSSSPRRVLAGARQSTMSMRGRLPPSVKHAYRSARRAACTLTAPLRPLPDFLIIGAQKAGTTSLYDYLAEHPQVAPAATKEVHYFDDNHRRSVAWYRGHFALRRRMLTGEATPYYLFHPLAAGRVRGLLPSSKLIVMLRHPVDRAYSAYVHERSYGLETLSFEDALAQEPSRLLGEEDRLMTDPGHRSFAHAHYAYLARGRYAPQVRRWLALFPREQFLFLKSEDLFMDPAGVYGQALDFLGLPPYDDIEFSARNARTYAPISPTLHNDLSARFKSDNEELYELIGYDLGWGVKLGGEAPTAATAYPGSHLTARFRGRP